MLYTEIKRNSLFQSPVAKEDRSLMNIPFIFNEDIKENDSYNFCEVLLSNNKLLNAMVVAGCDGRNSNVAKIAKLNEIKTNYIQTAITFTANAKLDYNHTAIQIFSDKGIFAIIPCPSDKNGPTHTIVWSVNNDLLDK